MLTKFSASIAICFFTKSFCFAQYGYIPPKPVEVSDEDYRAGKHSLETARSQIHGEIVAIDYWNFAMAYSKMGQPGDSIFYFLQLAKVKDEKTFCEIVVRSHQDDLINSKLYRKLGDKYKNLIANCSQVQFEQEETNPEQYAEKNKFDLELIKALDRIRLLDQKYRLTDSGKQILLDNQNQKDVELIIKKWGYPGRNLVGDKYESVCWVVIQHADLSYQEKYLELIHKAVKENQLGEVPLKMLLDRIYWHKTGTQIFGSQAGVAFAEDKTIEDVKRKYNLK